MTKRWRAVFLLSAALSLSAGCASHLGPKTDPYYEPFYQKAQLIMLDAEKRVYRLLEDKAAKEEFIEEFWRIRDPNPATEENEMKTAFEERVRYVSRYFSGGINVTRRQEDFQPSRRDDGWQTDMGRIFIVLGPPDYIVFEGGHVTAGDVSREQIGWAVGDETWSYRNANLMLKFERTDLAGGMASHFLLLKAMEDAVLDMVSPAGRADWKKELKFTAAYQRGAVVLRVPATSVSFQDEGGRLGANFRIRLAVYLNGRKLDTVETEQPVETTEDSLAEQEFFNLTVPYPLRGAGRYLFDILLEDLNSLVPSRSRATAKARR